MMSGHVGLLHKEGMTSAVGNVFVWEYNNVSLSTYTVDQCLSTTYVAATLY